MPSNRAKVRAKRKAGIPVREKPHLPTTQSIRMARVMAGLGSRRERIAETMGISLETLDKYYGEMMKTAKEDCIAACAENLFQKAMRNGPGAAALQIFYMKTQAHWKETVVTEHRLPPNLGIDFDDAGGPGQDRVAEERTDFDDIPEAGDKPT